MTEDIFFEIHKDLPREGPGRDRYTRKAYRMLPEMENPRILDVGCGPGGPTMELARLSRGEVIGLDTHQPYLDRLGKKIEEAGFFGRVKVMNRSMFDMDFPKECFDIIWAEGSIYIIGFEKGLAAWRRFIRGGGFLVANEMAWLRENPPEEIRTYWESVYPDIRTIPQNLERIPRFGYDLIGHFIQPEDAWWVEYYGPLEQRIRTLREKYRKNDRALGALEEEQREIDMYRKFSRWYGSVFFVMRKG